MIEKDLVNLAFKKISKIKKKVLTAFQLNSSQRKSLFSDRRIRIFVNHKLSKRHHNDSFDYENNKIR